MLVAQASFDLDFMISTFYKEHLEWGLQVSMKKTEYPV